MQFAMKTGLGFAALLFAQMGPANVSHAEVCHFAGTTDPAGRVAITTDVTATGGITRVDVALTFNSTTMFWVPIHYLVDEVSQWRAGELESVAVNTRYLIGNHIVRQLWDRFQRGSSGMQAQRVQAKTLSDFRAKHPGFVQHWDPATFGQSWLQDYPSASPERRADLDLNGSPLPSSLRSPLAMAFYWIRWLPSGGEDVAVFLPGFKADRVVHLPVTGASSGGVTMWQAPVRYPALQDSPASTAEAWTSAGGNLLRLTFDLHERRGSAHGVIEQKGCQGAPVVPTGRR